MASNKRVHSVSLVPYHHKRGYLFCTEMRKIFPPIRSQPDKKELRSHLIGGRVEIGETPLYAACREFVEEVPFNSCDAQTFHDSLENVTFVDTPCGPWIHRSFVFHISDVKDSKLRANLYKICHNFDVSRSELLSLFYWKFAHQIPENASGLLVLFCEYFRAPPLVQDFLSENEIHEVDRKQITDQ